MECLLTDAGEAGGVGVGEDRLQMLTGQQVHSTGVQDRDLGGRGEIGSIP